MRQQQIIYSMRVMARLVELGFQPIATIPNPQDNKYTSWLFQRTPELEAALMEIREGCRNDK